MTNTNTTCSASLTDHAFAEGQPAPKEAVPHEWFGDGEGVEMFDDAVQSVIGNDACGIGRLFPARFVMCQDEAR